MKPVNKNEVRLKGVEREGAKGVPDFKDHHSSGFPPAVNKKKKTLCKEKKGALLRA